MLGGSAGVSGDVLAGRDLEITWEDVYRGMWFSRLDHSWRRAGLERPTCCRKSANA